METIAAKAFEMTERGGGSVWLILPGVLIVMAALVLHAWLVRSGGYRPQPDEQ